LYTTTDASLLLYDHPSVTPWAYLPSQRKDIAVTMELEGETIDCKARHATYNRSRDCTEPAVTSSGASENG
jgi:hypothetical protein